MCASTHEGTNVTECSQLMRKECLTVCQKHFNGHGFENAYMDSLSHSFKRIIAVFVQTFIAEQFMHGVMLLNSTHVMEPRYGLAICGDQDVFC